MSDGAVVFDIELDGDKAKKQVKSLSKTIGGGFTKALKGVAIGVAAVGAAGAAITAATMKVAAMGDRVDKMSQKMGLARDTFQEYDFIVSQSGASMENLQMGMKTLITSAEAATKEGSKQSEMFKEMGVNVLDANGQLKTQEQLFEESVKALQKMEKGTKKAAIANTLFSRAGQELAPLLNTSTEAMEDMRKEAHELGLVMTDESVDSSVELTDTIDKLKRSLAGAMVKVLTDAIPIINDLAETFMTLIPIIAEGLTPVIEEVLPVFAELVKELFPVFVEVIQKLLPPFVQIVDAILPAFISIVKLLIPVLNILINVILPPLLLIIQGLSLAIQALSLGFEWFLGVIQKIGEGIWSLVSEVFEPFITFLKEDVLATWVKIWDIATNPAVAFSDKVRSIFTALKEFYIGYLSSMWESVSNLFNKIKNLKMPKWAGGSGSSSSGGSTKKMGSGLTGGGLNEKRSIFASGGIVSGPVQALVGEYAGARNNPEVIAPLDKLKDMIGGVGKSVVINVTGNNIANDVDIDMIGERLMRKLSAEGVA